MKTEDLNKYGDKAEFKYTDLSKPKLKPGHVVVRVAAASLNTIETMIRQLRQNSCASWSSSMLQR